MSNIVEVEDYQVIEVIEQVIQEAYESHKAQMSSRSSLRRRIARASQTLLNTLKKHVRQAPFDPHSLVLNLPQLRLKLLQEQTEPENFELSKEVDALMEEVAEVAREVSKRFKVLATTLDSAMVQPVLEESAAPPSTHHAEIQQYKAICEHAKRQMHGLIEVLKQTQSDTSLPAPDTNTQVLDQAIFSVYGDSLV